MLYPSAETSRVTTPFKCPHEVNNAIAWNTAFTPQSTTVWCEMLTQFNCPNSDFTPRPTALMKWNDLPNLIATKFWFHTWPICPIIVKFFAQCNCCEISDFKHQPMAPWICNALLNASAVTLEFYTPPIAPTVWNGNLCNCCENGIF